MRTAKDISGQIFTYWEVVSFARKIKTDNGIEYFWLCKCKCGVLKEVDKRRLMSGSSKSCGCWRMEQVETDIRGIKYGKLTGIAFSHKKVHKSGTTHYWKFRCDCGNEKTIRKSYVINGTIQCCGCDKYGLPVNYIPEGSRLRFLKQTRKSSDIDGKHYMAKALYECVCGNIRELTIAQVKSSHTKSCGCIRPERQFKKHGLHAHPLYKVYYNIHKRCYKENNPAYGDYGGRGVIVCEEWLKDPIAFVKWGITSGWAKGLEVDKDIIPKQIGIPALIYSPQMCSIVTRKKNANAKRSNKIIELNGQKKNLSEWSEVTGIGRLTISARIKNGWCIEDELTKPVNKKHKKNK